MPSHVATTRNETIGSEIPIEYNVIVYQSGHI